MKIEIKGNVTTEIIERLYHAFDVTIEDGKIFIETEEGGESSE